MFYGGVATLIVAIFSVPWMIIIIVIYVIVCLWLFFYSVPGYKDSYRLYTVAMSPILSFY